MSSRFIGKYEIVSTLGRGSMGVVYKGRDPEIGRLVAIKTLKSMFMGDDPAGAEAMQRFRLESRSAGRLQHNNIVTIFEAGKTEGGSPYMVMEYIEGRSLEAMLSEQGRLEPSQLLHYISQIADAIDYAHRENVIHRDIKPSNILVDAQDRPYLLDFGVAKLSDSSLTPTGTVVGTPSYMSPEQIRGISLDGGTDQFSLAVVAFECLAGSRPFPGNDFSTVVGNIIHRPPVSFAHLALSIPSHAELVLHRALAKTRDERFLNCAEFVRELAASFGVGVSAHGLQAQTVHVRAGAGTSSDIAIKGPSAVASAAAAVPAVQTISMSPAKLRPIVEARHEPGMSLGAVLGVILSVVVLLCIGVYMMIERGKKSNQVPTAVAVTAPKGFFGLGANADSAALKDALRGINDVSNPGTLKDILSLLDHQEFSVRIEALKTLQRLKLKDNEVALAALAKMLRDPDYLVRGFAVKTIASIGGNQATAILEARLVEEDQPIVRKVLSEVLAKPFTD